MSSNYNLNNKVAVITGGGSGIGRSTAFHLVREGAMVCLLDINFDHVAEVKEQIERIGGKALAITVSILLLLTAISQPVRTFNQGCWCQVEWRGVFFGYPANMNEQIKKAFKNE